MEPNQLLSPRKAGEIRRNKKTLSFLTIFDEIVFWFSGGKCSVCGWMFFSHLVAGRYLNKMVRLSIVFIDSW